MTSLTRRTATTPVVTVTVKAYVIDAVNDSGAASPSTGGIAIASVFANDTLGGRRAITNTVMLSLTSPDIAGVPLDLADGSADVAKGAALGTYTAVVVVRPHSIDAVNAIGIKSILSTGAVTVGPKTDSGNYALIYQICELASPTNCDSATATLELSGCSR